MRPRESEADKRVWPPAHTGEVVNVCVKYRLRKGRDFPVGSGRGLARDVSKLLGAGVVVPEGQFIRIVSHIQDIVRRNKQFDPIEMQALVAQIMALHFGRTVAESGGPPKVDFD